MVKGFLDPVTVSYPPHVENNIGRNPNGGILQVDKIHILGSGYQTELLAQIPKENLPKQFGGECACEGGCEYSDAGPWNEPQYRGPAFADAPKPTPTEAAAPAPIPEAAGTAPAPAATS